jgi:hypothetical protein
MTSARLCSRDRESSAMEGFTVPQHIMGLVTPQSHRSLSATHFSSQRQRVSMERALLQSMSDIALTRSDGGESFHKHCSGQGGAIRQDRLHLTDGKGGLMQKVYGAMTTTTFGGTARLQAAYERPGPTARGSTLAQ